MAELLDYLYVPLILFLTVVSPCWIMFHYMFKRGAGKQLSKEERALLDALTTKADQMKHRVEVLESILDSETPNWRDKR
ncbi:MAG: envelope stress response membrane protein PspB [Pseudomonadales bacterium]|nr:envelope stress response membrane protein PspB [Pseudomonadales bacterium]